MITPTHADAPDRQTAQDTFLPPLLSFGPLFMVLGLEKTPGLLLLDHVCALGGALALAMGLLLLFTRQVRLARRLDDLERPGLRIISPGSGPGR